MTDASANLPADLPAYDDLPEGPIGGRLGWHVFGPDDQIGLVNLLTPQRVAEAASLIKRGEVFPLDHPFGFYTPPLNPKRHNPEHHVLQSSPLSFDDYYDNAYPQAGSQWDSFAHVGYRPGVFYNGVTTEQILAGEANGFEHVAQHGIAGRAVVFDMPKVYEGLGRDYDPGEMIEFEEDALQAAAEHAGITHRPGDIIVLYTGFEEWYAGQDQAARDVLPDQHKTPGIGHTEATARYLWDIHASAIVSDNYAVEAWPAKRDPENNPFGFIHQMLIGSFGMLLGELWHLSELVEDCRATGVYEGMLVSAPMRQTGSIGSTASSVIIK